MKKSSKPEAGPFQLKILGYGNGYYIDRIGQLEARLARHPRRLQIDLIGDGEIPADLALLIRSILLQRSARTRIITNARSSLQGGSVLVWLTGDCRLIRPDARLFLRRAELPEDDDAEPDSTQPGESKYSDSYSEIDPEEADYARMLQVINEFLPVKELAGRIIDVPMLRQFGLIENEKLDHFLTTAFGHSPEPAESPPKRSKEKPAPVKAKTPEPGQAGK